MSNDPISISLDAREVTGKAVKQLRRDGQVPAVIHDHGKDSVIVQAGYVPLLKVWQEAGKHHPVNLKAGGKNYVALIRTATFDPKKNQLTHVVFNAVRADEKVDAEVPIQPKYDEGNDASPAERSGLIVLSQLETVTVSAVASQLPDMLYYNAEKLVQVGDHVTVADLKIPKGVELKVEESHAVATVYEPSALAAANDAAGGDAEPGDEASIESEHESSAEEGTQNAEIRPGGKQEFEDKEQGTNPTQQ
jgi:large subunit ribosomal protein L25